MSTFNTVDIPLDLILLKSDSVPSAMSKIISNQGLLEKYLEDLYNKIEIEFGTKVILGKSNAIGLINMRKSVIASLNDAGDILPDSGLYITKTVDDFSGSGYFKAIDINGSFGTELGADVVRINKKMVLESGAFIENINGDGEIWPYEFIPLTIDNTANNELVLSSGSKNIIVIDLVVDTTLYDSGAWIDNGNVPITIKMDTNNPVRDGQFFTIVVRNVFQSDGTTAITDNYTHGLIHFVGDSTFEIKNYVDSENKLVSNTSGTHVKYNLVNTYVKLTDTGDTDANFLLKK